MYEAFFGLRERPFELTPDPRFLLLTPPHREALATVQYGITSRRGLTLLVGEAGTGKTTTLRKALETQTDADDTRRRIVYLNNPTLTRDEFFESLAYQSGVLFEGTTSKARFLRELERALLEREATGEATVLVVDEAQGLPDELLEEIRLLGNIETDTRKLLPVVLAGQPEIWGRLNQPHLRQLKQRVALRCSLAPLNTGQVAAYIAGRVSFAGGDPVALFTRDAVAAIAMRSRGIPRLVSVICDNALLNGFALGLRPVDGALIHEVCADLDLLPSAPLSSSVPATSDPAAARQRPALHAAGNVRSFFSHVIGTAERAFRPTARVVHR